MALTEKQKKRKEKLHGKLRGFFAENQIRLKDAAEFLDEDYNTFIVCLSNNRYSNKKVEAFLEERDKMKQKFT